MNTAIKTQKGFTLIELMVVIVIIGILSALAIPKMFGVSAKAKAAEAPNVISNWETLQSAYVQETGGTGLFAAIGFVDPTASSKWFTYATTAAAAATITFSADVKKSFGDCVAGTDKLNSLYTVIGDVATHPVKFTSGNCPTYIPNF